MGREIALRFAAEGAQVVRAVSDGSNYTGSIDYYDAGGEHVASLDWTDSGTLGGCMDPVATWYGQRVSNCDVGSTRTLWPACREDVLGELELGARIEGPVGPEVEASIISDGRSIGDIVSYVACPAEYDECDPEDLPEGTRMVDVDIFYTDLRTGQQLVCGDKVDIR